LLIIPAIVVLFTYVYWRLHQVFEVFQPLTIYAAFALVAFGLLLDLRVRAIRFRGSPLLALLVALFVWCVITIVIKAPEALSQQLVGITTCLIAFLAVSEGLQGLRSLGIAAGVLVLFSIALASLGVQQGLSPTTCYMRAPEDKAYDATLELSDGRSCDTSLDCVAGGVPNVEYNCEHSGMLDTHSIGGRVRYRGILEDPNELSWAINMAMPFAFALYERRRTLRRLLIAILAVVLGAACVIMTQSRSGQIGILATLGVYFIRRFRWRGALLGAVAAIPLLILGGRSGEGAESSSEERLNCWNEALSMWRDNPIMGVGKGQFTEHYYLTAHNSFLLSLAELGPLGLFLWSAAVYYAIKVTVQAQIQLAGRPEAATARSWSMALLASLVALVASAVFLTLTFHAILWINLGLAGALYAAIRSHEPSFRVGFGWKDVGAVAAFDVAFVSAISIYLRVHGI
jgi:hypothetical protein